MSGKQSTGAPSAPAQLGHLQETERLLVTLGILAGVTVLLGVGHALRAGQGIGRFLRDGSFWSLVLAAALVAVVYAARRLGTWADTYDVLPPSAHGPGAAFAARHEARPDTVICCSGGGIKSAAFCLGALQSLSKAGVYQRADAVVGVSGGGYAAAAFAAMGHRLWDPQQCAPTRIPFTAESDELASLRRRTNYFGTRGRVRFRLLTTLLAGILVNVTILSAFVVWLASIIAHYLVLTENVTSTNVVVVFLGEWWYVLMPTIVFGLAMVLVLRRDLPPPPQPPPDRPARGARAARHTATMVRGGYHVALGGQRPSRERATKNVPATLGWVAALLLVCLVAVPWGIRHGQSSQGPRGDLTLPSPVSLPVLLGSLAALSTAVISTVRGIAAPLTGGGPVTDFLQLLRRHAAPWLATLLVLALTYVLTVTATSFLIPWVKCDNPWRKWLVIAALAVPVAFWTKGSTNWASAHRFYRDRLAEAYLLHPATKGEEQVADIELAALRHRRGRWPELVLVATANVLEGDVLPTGRGGTPFLLSPEVGLTDRRLPDGDCRVPVALYHSMKKERLTLAEATAVSGAAYAPTSGRESRMLAPYRLLLAFLNIRLGLWMRNPGYPLAVMNARPSRGRAALRWVNDLLDRPTALNVVAEAFGVMSVRSPYLYVSDGGHFDNLGLVEALRRRPRRIIVLDGTGDDEDRFPVVGHAMATARMEFDTSVDIDLTDLMRGDRPFTSASYVTARATYPDKQQCEIVYIKCALPDGLSWDLTSYRLRNPGFPATTQRFEMFDEFDFEAFRHLGNSLVDVALRRGAIT